MPRIYLAFRKTDTHPDIERIVDGLVAAHGAEAFIQGISPTASPAAARTLVEAAIRESVGVILLVGSDFNTQPDALGRRRLDNPDDQLRIEMEAALKFKPTALVVAAVGGVTPPAPADLPRSLQSIARRGWLSVGANAPFKADLTVLSTGARRMLNGTAKRLTRSVAAVAVFVIMLSAALVIYSSLASSTAY